MTNSAQPKTRTLNLRPATAALAIAIAFCVAVTTQPAHAQTYRVIHNFTGAEGADPEAGLTPDRAGNFYGTTAGGSGGGTVFKLVHSGSAWTLVPLYSFSVGYDGLSPLAPVTIGPDGTLYGTTLGGGYSGGNYCSNGGCGVVFNLKPGPRAPVSALAPWTQTVLRAFTGPPYDGDQPVSGPLIFDQAGNLYGTTQFGGPAIGGVVFELTPANGGWTETILYNFTYGATGGEPQAGVVMDSAGNLYGTTSRGGPIDAGIVYQLSPTANGWTETVLHVFTGGNDGSEALGGLVMDRAGNLYGATAFGGLGNGGVVYELSPYNGGWTYKVIFSLSGPDGGPHADLTLDAAGNLYGAAYGDGANEAGMIFKLTQSNGSWTLTDLHDFSFKGEYFPYGAVTLDANGNLYGTVSSGGAYGKGAVWEITP